MNIPIIHFFNNNYVIPAAVSFYSMLEHADKKHDYFLYVGHSDITVKNQDKLKELIREFPNAQLEFINMNNEFEHLLAKTKRGGIILRKFIINF